MEQFHMIVRCCAAVSFAVLLFVPEAVLAQDLSTETPFTVKLASPVSTKTNRPGDKVGAIVQEPEAYKGDSMEGVIKESKSGGRVKRGTRLLFDFDTLYHKGKPIPVWTRLVSVTNSKGQKDADEEGEIVKGSSWVKKLAFPVFMAVKGPSISFDTNSEFNLRVKQGHAPNGQ
jgi:hypothetical protein